MNQDKIEFGLFILDEPWKVALMSKREKARE